jgi:hypothetical protein
MSYTRRGMGGTVWDTVMSQVPGTAQFCADPASLLSPFQALCLPSDVSKTATAIISPTVAPPAPLPPGITTFAASPTDPGATYAGLDANGNPVYVIAQTAAQNAAANAAALSNFFANYAAANPATDCTTFLNSSFNPTCGGSLMNLALVVGGTILALMFFGGRR